MQRREHVFMATPGPVTPVPATAGNATSSAGKSSNRSDVKFASFLEQVQEENRAEGGELRRNGGRQRAQGKVAPEEKLSGKETPPKHDETKSLPDNAFISAPTPSLPVPVLDLGSAGTSRVGDSTKTASDHSQDTAQPSAMAGIDVQALAGAFPGEGATPAILTNFPTAQGHVSPTAVSKAVTTDSAEMKAEPADNSALLEGVPVPQLPNNADPKLTLKADATASASLCNAQQSDATACIVAENVNPAPANGDDSPKLAPAKSSEPNSSAVARDISVHKQTVIEDKTGLPKLVLFDSGQAQPASAERVERAASHDATSRASQNAKAVGSVVGASAVSPSSQPAESRPASPPLGPKSEKISAPAPSDVPRNTPSATGSAQKSLSDEKTKDPHANSPAAIHSGAIPPPTAGPTMLDTAAGPVITKSSSGTMPERPGESNGSSMPRDSAGVPALADEKTSVPVSSAVHDVRILDRAAQAEMHIGLRTAAFGGVEVHAVVRESQVGLTIGSERGDLHHLFANEVPGIVGRLQQHDLRLDSVKFFEQGLNFDAGTASGSNPQPRTFSQGRPALAEAEPAGEFAVVASEPETLFEARSGINVRA